MKPLAVAVKILDSSKEILINAEKEVLNLCYLRRAVGNRDCSISLAIAIVFHGDGKVPLLIFPFANRGNLREFLDEENAAVDRENCFENVSFDERFPKLGPWSCGENAESSQQQARYQKLSQLLLKQCLGLAEALRLLHVETTEAAESFRFVHMDIKPDNILICNHTSSDVGIWKLADFGISSTKSRGLTRQVNNDYFTEVFHSVVDLTVETIRKRNTGTHQAPEIHSSAREPQLGIMIGRSSDIWSFAAVSAEVLALALGGKKSVVSFRERRFTKNDADGAKIDPFWEKRTNSLPSIPEQSALQSATGVPISSGIKSHLDSHYRNKYQVNKGVTSYLSEVEKSFPLSKPWVKFISEALQVAPRDRPRAHDMFLSVNEAFEQASGTQSTLSVNSPAGNLSHDRKWSNIALGEASSKNHKHEVAQDARLMCFAECWMAYLADGTLRVRDIIILSGHRKHQDVELLAKSKTKHTVWTDIAAGGSYVVLYGYEQEKRSSFLKQNPKEPIVRGQFLYTL